MNVEKQSTNFKLSSSSKSTGDSSQGSGIDIVYSFGSSVLGYHSFRNVYKNVDFLSAQNQTSINFFTVDPALAGHIICMVLAFGVFSLLEYWCHYSTIKNTQNNQ